MRFKKLLKLFFKLMTFVSIILLISIVWKDLKLILNKKRSLSLANLKIKENEDYYEWLMIKQKFEFIQPLCNQIPYKLVGRIKILKPNEDERFDPKSTNLVTIRKNYHSINGKWKPINCVPRHRIAIIIPFKDREMNLKYFLYHMHPFLQKQDLEYQIFVVEQFNDQLFNKGILMNAGFLEIMNLKTEEYPFDCVIFHDVDLLPEDDRIMYTCPFSKPRHLSVAIDKYKYKMSYFKLIGGVLNFKIEHFIKVNGYSNEYWGWGAEDDDMETRLSSIRLGFERPNINIARYKMIKHKSRFKNPRRTYLLKQAKMRYQKDGLSNVIYKLNKTIDYKFYTHMYVDVGTPPQYILELLAENEKKTSNNLFFINNTSTKAVSTNLTV